jgi:hypothetical protein
MTEYVSYREFCLEFYNKLDWGLTTSPIAWAKISRTCGRRERMAVRSKNTCEHLISRLVFVTL